MGGQHFAMRIYIHPAIFGLLQQFFQIVQVVAAYQDTGACPYPDIHTGDFRMAITRRIRLVEQSHCPHTHFPGFQHQGSQLVGR